MASRSQKAHEYFEQMRTRQIQLSSQRNAGLLQQLNDLEEKVKESSLKTERLKLLREEARKEAQEAARNSKPPIPRKEGQVHVGPLTSTPYRTSPIMRGLDGINFSMLHPDMKAPGSIRNSRTCSPGHLDYLRTMDKFPHLRTGKNSMQKCPEKSTKSPVRHPNVLQSNLRFQRKIDYSIKSAKMAPDIAAIPGCSSYKPNSQNFNEESEEIPIEELSSENEEFSDEEYSSDKVYEESPDHVKLMTKMGILENAKMETMIPAMTESIFNEETLIRSKLPDKIEIPSKVRFLVNDESVSLPENQSGVDGSIDTQAEIHVDAGSMTKTKSQVIHEQSNQADKSFTVTTEQKLSAKIAEAEIATVAEEIVGNMENEEIAGIIRQEFFSKNENPIQPEFVFTEDMDSQNQETKVFGILSTSETTMTETLEEPNIPMPSESSIPTKVEHLVEPENAGRLEEEVIANNESVNEENLEDKISPETITTNPDNLIKMTETDDASKITEITPSPELFDTVRNLRTDSAIDKQEEKATGGILSFLSSDEDDDDEDDSFFDSIPKPHAPVLAAVVQERMPNPQLKQNAAMKPEETSDTLSDDVDSDIDHQLANLVAPTAPIRFVEHELAQSEHELQKEESSPSKNPHLDRTTKDANSARSSESSLTSLPNPAQAVKQPSQKLHQKLAAHLGLDTPYKISKPDLKKDEDKLEEDDFDFYD